MTSEYSLIFLTSISASVLFHPASNCSVSFAVLILEHMICRKCFLRSIFIYSVVLHVSSWLPTSLPYKNTDLMQALVILSLVLTARCGSLLNILVSEKDAALALLSLFSKLTLYLSFLFERPRYVDEGLLVIVSPARRSVDVVEVPLKIAYSVFVVFILRSYSFAQISTWSHSSWRLCLDLASSTRSSAYRRQLILGRPWSLSPVPCLFSLLVSCSGIRLKSSGEVTAP